MWCRSAPRQKTGRRRSPPASARPSANWQAASPPACAAPSRRGREPACWPTRQSCRPNRGPWPRVGKHRSQPPTSGRSSTGFR
jgi:hypothetical protein